MKRLKFSVISLFICFLMSIALTAQAADKMGYVDLSRLFDEYHKTKEYDKVLEGQHTEFEKTRNDMIEKIREAQGKLGLLADDKKAGLEEEIEKMKTDLLEFDRQKKTDLTKDRNEKIRGILLEIEQVVSDFAKKENYSLILNDRVLIYGSESIDITETILKELNKGK